MNTLYQNIPDLLDDEFQSLKEDIRQNNGVQVPVLMDELGSIIDGHHRHRAWEELRDEGVELPDYPVVIRADLDEAGKRELALTLNLCRRHLTREQKRELVENYLREHPECSNGYIAGLFKVSPTTVATIIEVSCCRFRGHHIRWTRRNRRWGWARDDDTVGSTSRRRCS